GLQVRVKECEMGDAIINRRVWQLPRYATPERQAGDHETVWCLSPAVLSPCDAATEGETMQFGLFGSAAARRGGPEFDSSEGFRDFIEYNVEAEAPGFHSTFVVEHHFTGYGQVSATLNLLTCLGARTRRLPLRLAVIVLPWPHPVRLAE